MAALPDESFNSQSNRDQKTMMMLQRQLEQQRGRPVAVGGDRGNVNDILTNFNREKE